MGNLSFVGRSSSSRMCVLSHNWSARKQRRHLQSVAGISRYSALSEDLAAKTQISPCKSPFPFAGTAASLFHAKMIRQRPTTVTKEGQPGCRIVGSHTRWELTTWADFQLCIHQLLMSTGCKSSHSGLTDVNRSNCGLTISGQYMPWTTM